MLELPALDFISMVAEIRRLATVMDQFPPDAGDEVPTSDVRSRVAATIGAMREHLITIAAQSAWVAADRFYKRLEAQEQELSYPEMRRHIADIESRFADHLSFIRLFVARPEQLHLLGSPSELLGEPTASLFTSAWFDCEEAAKCLLVLRPTAAVFHAMRMLEIAIRAFANRLGIPDPVKPAERNWGVFLGKIKGAIDANYPPGGRLPGSEGSFLEGLYATLDSVRNPWRNEVMHVEGVYTDAEAGFILLCTIRFIQKMATSFDEKGDPVPAPPLPPLIDSSATP